MKVSIHARRATGDTIFGVMAGTMPVSIHARRATGDVQYWYFGRYCRRFNSRPSCDGRLDYSPESGEGGVSIHARRATGDQTRVGYFG